MTTAAGAVRDVQSLRWIRDLAVDDPPLVELIYDLQTVSYRRNRRTLGQVWPKDVFLQRAVDYAVVGRLPLADESGAYPAAEEAMEAGYGFVLVRGLAGKMLDRSRTTGPICGRTIDCLKVSGVAGGFLAIRDACLELSEFGLPVVAAADTRLARIAERVGFESLPAGIARKVIPLVAPLFVQAPWRFEGVGPEGDVQVIHPDFRDPASDEVMVHQKRVIFTPAFVPWVLRHPCFARPLRVALRSLSKICRWLPGTLSDDDQSWLERNLALAASR